MKKAGFSLFLFFFILPLAHAQQAGSLLFHLSAEEGVVADFARGSGEPTYLSQVSVIDDGVRGKALRCGYKQLLTWRAPGNIYAREGTLAFFWRAVEPFTPTEFPIFRVSFADHTSWDMTWLRIDYNGHGFDAFVTDNNLVRVRVSTTVDPLPAPDKWTHFALRWDETRGIRFYIDGREAARRDTTVTLNTGLDQFGPHSRIISPYKVQSMYNMVRGGDVDELVIYDKMLSEGEIAQLAGGAVPDPAPVRPAGAERAWRHFYGFDGAAPPVLEAEHTAVRKLGILDIYDVKRWFWKAGDGIRETTWPGVYNRSRIEGRNDYFQLPDWDCYSTSGQQVRFLLPDEPWNYVEVTGGAYGALGVSADAEGTAPEALARKERGTQRSFHRLAAERTGGTLVFTNDVQETPIQELNTFYVHEGDAPQGIARLDYAPAPYYDYRDPALTQLRDYILGRHRPGERQIALALPAGGASARDLPAAAPGDDPVVHFLIPADTRDLDLGVPLRPGVSVPKPRNASWSHLRGGLDGIQLALPALPASLAQQDGLIPLNITVKDPLWPLRDLLDFSFSVRPGAARTLWLDLRDRILPEGKPLWVSLAGAAPGLSPALLADMRISLIFKPYEEAKTEHIADRLNQVIDTYAMTCEENSSSRRQDKFNQLNADMGDLLKVDPDNQVGRSYWGLFYGEQAGPDYEEPQAPAGVPEWAYLQLRLLRQYRHVLAWYLDNRMIENGELGGGISDDTDYTNYYPGFHDIGILPDRLADGVDRLLQAAYDQGMLTNGMSTIQTDGLHTYEEGVNALVQMNIIAAGNPKYAERLMESARTYRDRIFAVNPQGHTLVRSDYFSATKMALEGVWVWTTNRSYFHTAPGLLLGDLYANPEARRYIRRFIDSMLDLSRTTPEGLVQMPEEVNFLTGQVRSWGWNNSMPPLWGCWQWTGDERYLKPVRDSRWTLSFADDADQVRQYRRDLKNLVVKDFIYTKGSIWTDRVQFPHDAIQVARLGAPAMNRLSHYTPTNAVAWRFEREEDATDVAIHVTRHSDRALTIRFYNTAARPVRVAMLGREARIGTWRLDRGQGREEQVGFGRSRSIDLTIPARREYTVRLELAGPVRDDATFPELGIGPEDVRREGGELAVTLHNLGGVDTPAMDVALVDARGRILARTACPAVPAPLDLQPKTATVRLAVPAGRDLRGCRVVIDPDDTVCELYETNNAVSL